MCSTLPPKRSCRLAANTVLPDAHGPSMATNAHRPSASNRSTRSIADFMLSTDSIDEPPFIRFAALQAPRSHHSNGLLEYGQTVGARADAQLLGILKRVLAMPRGDAFGHRSAIRSHVNQIDARLIKRHRVE